METYWEGFISTMKSDGYDLSRISLVKILEVFWHYCNKNKEEFEEIRDVQYGIIVRNTDEIENAEKESDIKQEMLDALNECYLWMVYGEVEARKRGTCYTSVINKVKLIIQKAKES